VRFSLVGSLNTVIDIALLNILVWMFPGKNAFLMVTLNSIAYTVGALNSFFWNKFWTFRLRTDTTGNQVLRFILVTGLGIVCNSAFLWLITVLFTSLSLAGFLWMNIAKLGAIMGSVAVSYLGMRFGVFTKPEMRRRDPDAYTAFYTNTQRYSILHTFWEGSAVLFQIRLFLLLASRWIRLRPSSGR
jgi:putative flippase GtrA